MPTVTLTLKPVSSMETVGETVVQVAMGTAAEMKDEPSDNTRVIQEAMHKVRRSRLATEQQLDKGTPILSRGGSWLWEWMQSPNGSRRSSRNPSAHGGMVFGLQQSPSTNEDKGVALRLENSEGGLNERDSMQRGLRRQGSWLWEWMQSPSNSRGSSRDASLRNGMNFGQQPHGPSPIGYRMRRSVSFSEEPGNEPILDNARTICPASVTADLRYMNDTSTDSIIRRTGSWLWEWRTPSVPASRESSVHGTQAFSTQAFAARPASLPVSREPSLKGAQAFGSFSHMMWDWSNGRISQPGTPNASLRGGNTFGRSDSNGGLSHTCDWPKGRVSQPATPGTSMRAGNAFTPEALPEVPEGTDGALLTSGPCHQPSCAHAPFRHRSLAGEHLPITALVVVCRRLGTRASGANSTARPRRLAAQNLWRREEDVKPNGRRLWTRCR